MLLRVSIVEEGMKRSHNPTIPTLFFSLLLAGLTACATNMPSENVTSSENENSAPTTAQNTISQANDCTLVESGYGSQGTVEIQVEEVVSGLEVPWGVGFLPNGDLLVTERPGRVRLVKNGQLQPSPVVNIPATARGEGGLLGIALHPDFAENRFFYLYYTTDAGENLANRVERWQLSGDGQSASPDQMIVDQIPVATYHNGGRLRFGPDNLLYIGTGDAKNSANSQNPNSLAGKILRVTPDGEIPADNPFPNNPVYLLGIRNTQGFDWLDNNTMIVTDHGPSGEFGWRGHDEVTLAQKGDNLGWAEIYGCQSQTGLLTPILTWEKAVPPGGAAIYTGDAIPQWQGDLLMGILGSRHLHRVSVSSTGELEQHEVYLQNSYGRLREVIMGRDDHLYVTTSNCDGRGSCPTDGDKILRISR
jgi:glucose/arabinose dehydrogenase